MQLSVIQTVCVLSGKNKEAGEIQFCLAPGNSWAYLFVVLLSIAIQISYCSVLLVLSKSDEKFHNSAALARYQALIHLSSFHLPI